MNFYKAVCASKSIVALTCSLPLALSSLSSFADESYLTCRTTLRVETNKHGRQIQDDSTPHHFELRIINQSKYVLVSDEPGSDAAEGKVIATPREYILVFNNSGGPGQAIGNNAHLNRETGLYTAETMWVDAVNDINSRFSETGRCEVGHANPKF